MAGDNGGSEKESRTRHGLCAACANVLVPDTGQTLEGFLDSLECPVVAVDGSGCVREANWQARALMGQDFATFHGWRGGRFFQCVHASEPGGCGHTPDCAGCEVRRAILTTYRTGEGVSGEPASLTQWDDDGPHEYIYRISTQRIRDFVLLRIDDVRVVA